MPLAMGGGNGLDNISVLCWACNERLNFVPFDARKGIGALVFNLAFAPSQAWC